MQDSQSTLQLSPIGYQNSRCGYCKNRAGSYNYYASAKKLSVEAYQALIERGWRRSGTMLYKPNLKAQCCCHYTIRLDASAFKPTKAQRQAINRFNNYVLGIEFIRAAARYYPKTRQEAAWRKDHFILTERIHECELSHLPGQTEQIKPAPTKSSAGKAPSTSKQPKVLPKLTPAHAFEVTLEPDKFTEEKYLLYENYQTVVHKDPPRHITRAGFTRFLCNSPLVSREDVSNGKTRRLGSYHQCYRLDGKLVAIGVLDLLPHAVSAVYFMYHESVHEWEFGKLGALQEIALALEDDYNWYMMGYYIHNCVKMRYKGDYHPQYVLDPESYEWHNLDDNFKALVEKHRYVSMSRQHENQDLNLPPLDHLSEQNMARHQKNGLANQADRDSSDEDEDDEMDDGLPLCDRGMPGVMTREQLMTEVDLDHIALSVMGQTAETCDLVSWEAGSIDNTHSVKGIVAELVAALGPALTKQLCVVFG